jgi:hypothetical protein
VIRQRGLLVVHTVLVVALVLGAFRLAAAGVGSYLFPDPADESARFDFWLLPFAIFPLIGAIAVERGVREWRATGNRTLLLAADALGGWTVAFGLPELAPIALCLVIVAGAFVASNEPGRRPRQI